MIIILIGCVFLKSNCLESVIKIYLLFTVFMLTIIYKIHAKIFIDFFLFGYVLAISVFRNSQEGLRRKHILEEISLSETDQT